MAALCKPLNQIGIDYLSYTRVYKNGERINLSSVPKVLEEHFSRQHYLRCGNEKHPDSYQSEEIIVWSTLPNQSLYEDAKKMGACNGIYLFGPKNEEYIDSFGFASSKNNSIILNSYFNHFDLLKKFRTYFFTAGASLLETAEQHKIVVPFNKEKSIVT